MKKYSAQQNMKLISDTCKEVGFNDAHFMVAKAKIESTLNNLAKNGNYWGLFQLSNGVGGIKGEDRLNPIKATKGAITYLNYNRSIVEKALGTWENFFGYLAHQQGAGGFTYIAKNPNMLVSQSKYKKNILNNIPKSAKSSIVYHKDFINYWRNVFNQLTVEAAKELACIEGETLENLADNTDLLYGMKEMKEIAESQGKTVEGTYPKTNTDNGNACSINLSKPDGLKSIGEQNAKTDYLLWGGVFVALFGVGFAFYKGK